MKPAPFVLHRPKTLDEALSTLAEVAEEGGLVLAGGQSLMPMMALRVAYPPHLVDINGVDELAEAKVDGDRLLIGATVRHARFHRDAAPGALGAMLGVVSRNIAHYPIRQRGTFCGSLAHADPASEWCLVAVTLDATMHLAGPQGERAVPASEFFAGAMTTVREAEELLVRAELPLLPGAATFGFNEFNRRAGDFAIGMALVAYEVEAGAMRNVRVGIGGIEENPRRLASAEAVLEGKAPGDDAFAEAGKAASDEVDPMEDATTSADYRRDLTAVVVRRALEDARLRQQHTN